MSNLKPAGYLIDDKEVFGVHDLFSNLMERYIKEGRAKPLYLIPEGYHIVPIEPITPDQAMINNIESHNEPLRGKGDE